MRIVFHGENAGSFSHDFQPLVGEAAQIAVLPDVLTEPADSRAYADADVIVGVKFTRELPQPRQLRLFHVPGAGYDAVDLEAVPGSAVVCNCFGHEHAIAEYVMAALLERHVPLAEADRHLRRGIWTYTSGSPARVHGELAEKTIGLLGFGHIGKAIAVRAKAFEMKVHVANRSPVPASTLVDRSFGLNDLGEFWSSADFFVVSVPSNADTLGMVNAESFAAMRTSAIILNVGRGPTIDERALYEALQSRRIAGAVIDTWYSYPSPGNPAPLPSKFPFQELPNVVMTPHMSGWTTGTIDRRRQTMAENIRRRAAGRSCVNVVRPARS
jgi:phosphoglycerate dehydrogenase-like enzyme